jgi:hypothetical protein
MDYFRNEIFLTFFKPIHLFFPQILLNTHTHTAGVAYSARDKKLSYKQGGYTTNQCSLPVFLYPKSVRIHK